MPLHPIDRRPATEADIPFLLALRAQTMSEHLANSGITPTAAERDERVRFQFALAEILLLEGEPVGLWKAQKTGKAWRLLQIQLNPAVQGLGVGRKLIQTLVDEARAHGASLSLGVLKANPARQLYERLGVQITSESAHGYEMALVAPSMAAGTTTE